MPALDATGRDRDVGDDVILRTPGLEGDAEVRRPSRPGERGPAGVTRKAMEQALKSTDLQAFRTVEIARARQVGGDGRAGRTRGGTDESYIELEAPDAGPDFGQVLLYQDEAGVITWHTGEVVKRAAERGTGRRTYRVWGGVAKTEGEGDGTRGLLSAIGSKVLTVVVFPLIDPVLGKVGDYFAQRWEARHRPYGIRTFGPTGYGKPTTAQWTAADWKRVAEGRALLFIHGTGSRSHSGFGALPPSFVKWVHATYEGRVFAVDHPTIGTSPRENAEWLIDQIPRGSKLDLDIICHSRGGLFSRVLAEQQSALNLDERQLAIRRLLMIGVPNAGTALADGDHILSFIDSYTTLLNLLPAPAVVDVLETLVTVVKQVALGAFKGLDGISSMLPKGAYLTKLNVGLRSQIPTRYFAMGSNFEPSQPGLGQFKDGIIDKIFGADNDGIVPTGGVADGNGSSMFPVADSHVFQGEVDHSGYFRNKEAVKLMQDWLKA
jgi:hypothetical protein